MFRKCRVTALGLFLLVWLGMTRLGFAQSSAEASINAVEIVLIGAVGAVPAFETRVTSWFDSAKSMVSVRRVPQLDPASILAPKPEHGVHAWVLLRSPNLARLYFASALGPAQKATYLVRELELPQGLDEMAAEYIAQVLYLSAVAMLDGQAATAPEEVNRVLREELSASKTPAPRAVPRQPRLPPKPEAGRGPPAAQDRARRRSINAELTLGYGVSLRGEEGVWHGPRIGIGVRYADGWGLGVLGQGAWPSSSEMDPVELSFYGGSVRLGGGMRHALVPGVALEWMVGPGFEVVRYSPVRSLNPSVTTGPGDTELRSSAFGGVSGIFRETSPRIAVTVECMVSLTRSHYNVVVDDSRWVVGSSVPLVPLLGMEMRW
jgi:hypothetical protein